MKLFRRYCVWTALLFVWPALTTAQQGAEQIADPDFNPEIDKPTHTSTHPLVVLDEAHANFHTASGRYKPFAELLEADGYHVIAGTQPFTADSLRAARVLVISNALGSGFTGETRVNPPPAFTDAESNAVRNWVRGGGSLLLIADHAPFGATTAALAARFDVEMGKGYVWTASSPSGEPTTTIEYASGKGLLDDHPITRGVTRVVAFTGQSLSVPAGAVALLRLGEGSYESSAADAEADIEAFRTGKAMKARSAASRAQAIAFDFGKGRIVMTGEAAMFSAQVVRFPDQNGKILESKMGMNVPGNDNQLFLRNIMRWLTRVSRE
jgi:hypothetical protein